MELLYFLEVPIYHTTWGHVRRLNIHHTSNL